MTEQATHLTDSIANMQDHLTIHRAALQREFITTNTTMSQLQSQTDSIANFGSSLYLPTEIHRMSLQRGLTTYRQTQVQSRTPLELVVMLYDGALTFLHQAREAIERGDIAARRDASSRAIAIISELQSTLNMEQGGEIAQRLDDLYVYVNGRIIAAAAENGVGPIDDATRVLTVLRESWVAIATPAADAAVRGAA